METSVSYHIEGVLTGSVSTSSRVFHILGDTELVLDFSGILECKRMGSKLSWQPRSDGKGQPLGSVLSFQLSRVGGLMLPVPHRKG